MVLWRWFLYGVVERRFRAGGRDVEGEVRVVNKGFSGGRCGARIDGHDCEQGFRACHLLCCRDVEGE